MDPDADPELKLFRAAQEELPNVRYFDNDHELEAYTVNVNQTMAPGLEDPLNLSDNAKQGLIQGINFLDPLSKRSGTAAALPQGLMPLHQGLSTLILCATGAPQRLLRGSGPSARAELSWTVPLANTTSHAPQMGRTGPGRGRVSADAHAGPDLGRIRDALENALKSFGAADVQVTVSTPDNTKPGARSATISASGHDRTLASATLQLVAARPATLFSRDQPANAATVSFRAFPGNPSTLTDTPILVVMRQIDGDGEDHQTINMLRRAGEATLRQLLGEPADYEELEASMRSYVGSVLWSLLNCSVRSYGRTDAERANLQQAYCPTPLYKYVVTLTYSTPFQAAVLQQARHIILGVRGESLVAQTALPFTAPAVSLDDTYVVLLRSGRFSSKIDSAALQQLLGALQQRAAAQQLACAGFAKRAIRKALLSLPTAPGVDAVKVAPARHFGFTSSTKKGQAQDAAPAAAAATASIPAPLREAAARPGSGRRAYVLNSRRDGYLQLLGDGALSPKQLLGAAYWCSEGGAVVPMSSFLVRIEGREELTFRAPEGKADIALLCPRAYDAASICAAGWCEASFNPQRYVSNQPSGLELQGPTGEPVLVNVGVRHRRFGGSYMHTGEGDFGAASSSSSHSSGPQLLQIPEAVIAVTRNMLVGDPIAAGIAQTRDLEMYRYAVAAQTCLMLHHSEPPPPIQRSNQLGSPAYAARQADRPRPVMLALSDDEDDDGPAAAPPAGGAAAGTSAGSGAAGSGAAHPRRLAEQLADAARHDVRTIAALATEAEGADTFARAQIARASVGLEQMSNALTSRNMHDLRSMSGKVLQALSQARAAGHAALQRLADVEIRMPPDGADAAEAAPHHARAREAAANAQRSLEAIPDMTALHDAAVQQGRKRGTDHDAQPPTVEELQAMAVELEQAQRMELGS
ncbi:hypothetical protein HXX76_014345 [Chlamydomonas incerta]|uniref:Uncharacterized protein n=1 Tax=Chlamydomonas incerta TaxID=51695 RepID=A0A835SPV7_CHLIN|nr:hypothetical protein HXX76_014345 [Chlamydomonas incerta]|eukprot:KAG2424620.1 hypothetical protein HXX76_014345 [Chlamydomonas incerta]